MPLTTSTDRKNRCYNCDKKEHYSCSSICYTVRIYKDYVESLPCDNIIFIDAGNETMKNTTVNDKSDSTTTTSSNESDDED